MAKAQKIGIGLAGLGFMGLTHLRASRGLRGGSLVAIATSDPRKARGDFSSVRGNFGAAGGKESLDGVRCHPTLESLLADEHVDLVDICLPSYLHAPAAIQCLRAGKHVLVEKPIALSAADARSMLWESEKSGRLLLVAQVLRFMPEFALVRQALRDKRWGRLDVLHLRRLIAMPEWGNSSWFGDPTRSGGMVVDLHIHDTDFIVQLFGSPATVSAHAVFEKGQVNFLRTQYHYSRCISQKAPSGTPLLSAEAGWINAPALAFEHGYDAFFERATLHFNSSHAAQPRLYGQKRMKEIPLPAADPFQLELQAAVDSVRTREADPLLSADSAATSLAVCRAAEVAARSGRRVVVRT
jgi:predicted dehydrogenase